MPEYQLIKFPNRLLEQKSEEVKAIDGEIRGLADFMISQLKPLEAIGFAAIQFGQLKRLIVIKRDELVNLVLVNPVIVKESHEHTVIEGCRSLPGKLYQLRRPKIVKCQGINLDEKKVTVKGHGLLAQVLKHEVDHCDGILLYMRGKLV